MTTSLDSVSQSKAASAGSAANEPARTEACPEPPSVAYASACASASATRQPPLLQRQSLPRIVAIAWAVVPALILVTAMMLSVGDNRQVIVPGMGIALPETCALYARFGVDCPGCGLTRGFIHLAHAEPAAAWHLNSMSWLIFAFVVAQIPLALAHLRGIRSRWLERGTRLNEWSLVFIVVLSLVRWVYKLSMDAWWL